MATLAVVFPLPAGVAGTGLDSAHLALYAYPGVSYSIVCGARGGTPLHRWSVSGPSGMTINSDTGILTWPTPTTSGSPHSVTVTVTDSVGATATSTYSLTVDATKFRWVDATSGSNANDGILVADGGSGPIQTLAGLQAKRTANGFDWSAKHVFFRSGTYTTAGCTLVTDASIYSDEVQYLQASGHSTSWRAYPGETVTFNFGSDHTDTDPGGRAACLCFTGDRIALDGFTPTDGFKKFYRLFRTSERGAYIVRNNFVRLGPGLNGANSACVMYEHPPAAGTCYFDVAAHNTVDTIGYGNYNTCLFKFYDMDRPYVAFNRNVGTPANLYSNEPIAYKASCQDWFDYRNDIVSTQAAWGGDMNSALNTCRGEVWYSRYVGGENLGSAESAIAFNQFSNAGAVTWTRCTIQGAIFAREVDVNDGPFTFTDCVIVNDDSGAVTPYTPGAEGSWTGVYDATRISIAGGLSPTSGQNLKGSSVNSILDADYLLTGSYRTSYLGTKGAEITTMAVTQAQAAASNSTVSATSIAATFGSNVTAGNVITVQVFVVAAIAVVGTMVTDSLGNTYTYDSEYAAAVGDMATFSTTTASSGPCVVTFTPGTAATRLAICAREFSGLTRDGELFDGGATATSAALATGSVTPSVSGGVGLAWAYSASGAPSSWGNSYTGDKSEVNGRSYFAYRITDSQASESATATFGGAITWYASLQWYAGTQSGGSTALAAGDVTTELSAWQSTLAGDRNTAMRDALATAFGETAPDLTTVLTRYIGR